ncbi:hypothetical protein D9V84_04180 [Bacteroidetes/Chlorobi group bacterium Naka2016]|nr:MAG: hypothetical protein D9V84_04180 [Bacteroidetes/Chlorobi group bacterium Naka2016]
MLIIVKGNISNNKTNIFTSMNLANLNKKFYQSYHFRKNTSNRKKFFYLPLAFLIFLYIFVI